MVLKVLSIPVPLFYVNEFLFIKRRIVMDYISDFIYVRRAPITLPFSIVGKSRIVSTAVECDFIRKTDISEYIKT